MKVSKFPTSLFICCVTTSLMLVPSGFLQSQNNTWKGTVSSAWNTAANWSTGTIPTSSVKVIISDTGYAPVVPPPTVSDTAKTGDLTINSGAELFFNPNPNPGILVVYGSNKLLNNGKVNLGDGKIIFKNSISFQNGGTFDAGNGSLDFQGVVWNNTTGSNFIAGTSTVTFGGAQPETLLGTISFYNIQFSNTSGAISLSGNITVTNSVIVDSGASVTLSSGSLTLTSTATLELSGGSTLTIQGAFNNSGTITGSGTISSSKPLIQTLVALSTTNVDITFSEPVSEPSAEVLSNYSIDRDITVVSATRDSTNHALVHLTLTALTQDTIYTVTVNNIIDETATDTIAASTQRQFAYPPEALPVQLASFSAKAARSSAELFWVTESEVNNFGFEVERRSIGSSSWRKIGFVAGSGTITSRHFYSHVDALLPSGRYAYRLKQIDNDGAFEYYGNAEVEIGVMTREFKLASNYPNPFNPTTTIEFTLAQDGRTTLKVYSILGQEVATLFDGIAQSGTLQQAQFDASRLSSGLYFARLESGKQQLVQKMVLLK